MPQNLGDAVLNLSVDDKALDSGLASAKSAVETALDRMDNKLQQFGLSIKQVGIAFTAMGGTITAALGLAIKSAEEERLGIMRLSQALKNIGEDYDTLKDSIESVISAQQRKTNFADDQQRDALANLIYLTGSYERAMKHLPLVLDLAAAKQMDLRTASDLVARVLQGNTSMLVRYGITLKEGASATEAIQVLTEKFGGSAEAMASPFQQLKNIMSDLAEAIGKFLLPAISNIVNAIMPVIDNIIKWTEAHPGLTTVIMGTVGAIGLLLLGLGTIILIGPKIVGAFGAMTISIGGMKVAAWELFLIIGMLAYIIDWVFTAIRVKHLPTLKEMEETINNLFAPLAGAVANVSGLTDSLNEATKAIQDFNAAEMREKFIWTSAGWMPKGGMMRWTIGEFQRGGIVPGPIGKPQLAVVHGGEVISRAGGITQNIYVQGSVVTERELTNISRLGLIKIKGRTVGDVI